MYLFIYLKDGTVLTFRHQNSVHEQIKSRFKSGNACYHSMQNLLSSSWPSKNLKIKIHRAIILLLFCVGVREEHRMRTFQNRVLRRIYGPTKDKGTGEWRSLMICTPHPIFSGDQIEKNEMSVACSTCGGEERYIQGFAGDT